MKISLVDVDGHNFPNLALMKLSAWHKAQGDAVEWYSPLFSKPDRIYASKVFTFTPDFTDYAAGDPEPVRGGTGYDPAVRLPDEVERTLPDYSIYPDFPAALGFLARGCIRKCPWCIVPEKEGALKVAEKLVWLYSDEYSEKRNNGLRIDGFYSYEWLDMILNMAREALKGAGE